MLDTVVLCHRSLSFDVLESIKSTLTARYGVNAASGEVDYIIWSGKGAFPESGGTYNCTIRTSRYGRADGDSAPVKRDCYPEVILEASLHKAMLGHNVSGGPTDWDASVRYLLHEFGKDVGAQEELSLTADDWLVRRIDVAEVFDLGSDAGVKDWLRSCKEKTYPRRAMVWWDDYGFMADGESTCLRAYAKGQEFQRNGRKQALYVLPPEEVRSLASYAARCLRIEVEVKRRLLDDVFGHIPTVAEIHEDWLEGLFDEEWSRFCRDAKRSEDALIKDPVSVERCIRERYGSRVSTLYPAWVTMAVLGERAYRNVVSRSAFYRVRAELEAIGVSWENTTLWPGLSDSVVGFVPNRASRFRDTHKHPRVSILEQEWGRVEEAV